MLVGAGKGVMEVWIRQHRQDPRQESLRQCERDADEEREQHCPMSDAEAFAITRAYTTDRPPQRFIVSGYILELPDHRRGPGGSRPTQDPARVSHKVACQPTLPG